MLQELQIKKLTHLFNILDFDHNGKLEKADFESIAENIDVFTGVVRGNEYLEKLRAEGNKAWETMRTYFKDETVSSITLDQWLEYMDYKFCGSDQDQNIENIQHLVSRIQEIFDKDGDVNISKLEFMTLFVSCRVEVRFAHKCFELIDENKDGLISTQELTKAMTDFFQSNDPEDSGNHLFGYFETARFARRSGIFQ
jgi:Ca2+-binding EF-hand superfamily protein